MYHSGHDGCKYPNEEDEEKKTKKKYNSPLTITPQRFP